jgi:hypothetical protein
MPWQLYLQLVPAACTTLFDVDLVTAESETHDLPREQKLALLKQLRKGLQLLHAQLLQAEAAPAQQVCL